MTYPEVNQEQRYGTTGHNKVVTWSEGQFFSQKAMVWLCYTLKEASKVKGNSVRRWKFQDHFSQFFCSRNYNKQGRCISIISTQGKTRSVIITPELASNTGWFDIAFKISNFINIKAKKAVTTAPRITEAGLPYAESVRRNKWTTREMNAATMQEKEGIIRISGVINAI